MAGTGADVRARMRAIVQERYGDVGRWRLGEVARPVPRPDEVLVEVRAAGIDRGTWHLMTGEPYLLRLGYGLRGPRTQVPGIDVAGVVAAVGSEVTRVAPGDEVVGFARGALAELAVVSEAKVARKPRSVGFTEAAVLPVSGVTALLALRDRAAEGQQVCVLGASGGVGSYVVQIAKAHGATVTGVCSRAKSDLVVQLGADRVVDYAVEDFDDRRYDVIVDTGGLTPLRRLRRALEPRGALVIVGGEGGGRWTGGFGRGLRAAALSPLVRQQLVMLVAAERGGDLEELLGMVEAGQVRPVLDRSYPLAEAGEAMRRLAAGEVRGKVAVTV